MNRFFFLSHAMEKMSRHWNYVDKDLKLGTLQPFIKCNYISAAYGQADHMLRECHTLVDFLLMSVFCNQFQIKRINETGHLSGSSDPDIKSIAFEIVVNGIIKKLFASLPFYFSKSQVKLILPTSCTFTKLLHGTLFFWFCPENISWHWNVTV